MNTSCWQCDRVRGQGSAVINGDGVQAHYAVLEKVRLHDGARSHRGTGTNVTQIRFGEPIGLNPRAAADLNAEYSQGSLKFRSTHGLLEKPRSGDGFHKASVQFI